MTNYLTDEEFFLCYNTLPPERIEKLLDIKSIVDSGSVNPDILDEINTGLSIEESFDILLAQLRYLRKNVTGKNKTTTDELITFADNLKDNISQTVEYNTERLSEARESLTRLYDAR